jgi:hypothetical protein
MNQRKDNRLPASLIWLLIYHGIIVLIGLGYLVAAVVILITDREYGAMLVILVLTCWTAAMFYAAVGMMRKRLRGLLVGMICHLILAILSNAGLATFAVLGVLSLLARGDEAKGWAPLFLLFALMWSPFALFSSWAFFYLRRLRKDLLA